MSSISTLSAHNESPASTTPVISEPLDLSRHPLFNSPDFYSVLRSYSTPRDYSRFERVSRVTRDVSRSNTEVQRLQLAAWLGKPESALPQWLHFVDSPYTAIRALVAQSPRGLHPDTYLGCLLQRLPPSAFKLDPNMTIKTACSILSSNRLQCGERTVNELVNKLVKALDGDKRLTAKGESQLRACIRDGSSLSPYRTPGDVVAHGQFLRAIELEDTGRVYDVTVLADGRLVTPHYRTALVLTKRDGDWDTVTLRGHTDWLSSATVVADGRLVTMSHDHTARVWTERNGSWESVVLSGHTHTVSSATALADGRLVTTSWDNTARVWTERNGSWDSIVLSAHTGPVNSATVLADGRLVTTSWDKTARVWNEQPNGSWDSIMLTGHTEEVYGATVLADGRLLTSSRHGTVRVWTEQPNGSWASVELSGLGPIAGESVVAVLADGRLEAETGYFTAQIWSV